MAFPDTLWAQEASCPAPEVSDTLQTSQLHFAIDQGRREDVAQALADGAGLEAAFSTTGEAPVTPLVRAIDIGDPAVVYMLLAAGAESNGAGRLLGAGPKGTPLGIAIERGSLAVVDLLIVFGADPSNVVCAGEADGVSHAAFYGWPDVVGRLLEATEPGSDALNQGIIGEKGVTDERTTVDFQDAQLEVLALLLETALGSDDEILSRALGAAVATARAEFVAVLLDHGVSPDATDQTRPRNPPHAFVAMLAGSEPLVAAFVDGGLSVSLVDNHANSALHYAAFGGSADIASLLIRRGFLISVNQFNQTPLMFAASPEVVPLLVNAGVPINSVDIFERDALSYAVLPTRLLMVSGYNVTVDPLLLAESLLEAGANVNAEDGRGFTALLSVATGRLLQRSEIAQLLVDRGADVTVGDGEGNQVIHLFADTGDFDVIASLFSRGVNIDEPDGIGRNAVMRALASEALPPESKVGFVQSLLRTPFLSDPSHTDLLGAQALAYIAEHLTGSLSAQVAEAFLLRNANLDHQDYIGQSALMLAASHSNLELARTLIDGGTNLDLTDDEGRTAAHWAAVTPAGFSEALGQPIASGPTNPVLIALSGDGADMRSPNALGETPFLAALAHWQFDNALFLLTENGNSVDDTDLRGRTGLMLAASSGRLDLLVDVLSNGADVCAVDEDGYRATEYAKANSSVQAALGALLTGAIYREYGLERPNDIFSFTYTGIWGAQPFTPLGVAYRRSEHYRYHERPIGYDLPRVFQSLEPATIVFDPRNLESYRICIMTAEDFSALRRCEELLEPTVWEIPPLAPLVPEPDYRSVSVWTMLKALDFLFFSVGLLESEDLVAGPVDPVDEADAMAQFYRDQYFLAVLGQAEDYSEGLNATCGGRSLYFAAIENESNSVLRAWPYAALPVGTANQDGLTGAAIATVQGLDSLRFIQEAADTRLGLRANKSPFESFHDAIRAAADGDTLVYLYLDSTVDKNAPVGTNATALMTAAALGLDEVVHNLLILGGDPNWADDDGATPLMWAASTGQLVVGQMLVQFGADPQSADDAGRTAADYAQQQGHSDFLEWVMGLN